MLLIHGIMLLIDMIRRHIFDEAEQPLSGLPRNVNHEGATLLSPSSDELVPNQIWPLFHQRVNISLLWRLQQVNCAWKDCVGNTLEWVALDMV